MLRPLTLIFVSFITFNCLSGKVPCKNIYEKIVKFRPFKNYRWDPVTIPLAFKSEEIQMSPGIYKEGRISQRNLKKYIEEMHGNYVIKKNIDGTRSIGILTESLVPNDYYLRVYKFKKKDLDKIGYELEHLGGNSYLAVEKGEANKGINNKYKKFEWDPATIGLAIKSEDPVVGVNVVNNSGVIKNTSNLKFFIDIHKGNYAIKKNIDGSLSIAHKSSISFKNLVMAPEEIIVSYDGLIYNLYVERLSNKTVYEAGYKLNHLGGNTYTLVKMNKVGWNNRFQRMAFNSYHPPAEPMVTYNKAKITRYNVKDILKPNEHLIVKNTDGTYHVAKLKESYNSSGTEYYIGKGTVPEEKTTTHVLEVFIVQSVSTFKDLAYELELLGEGYYTAIDKYNPIVADNVNKLESIVGWNKESIRTAFNSYNEVTYPKVSYNKKEINYKNIKEIIKPNKNIVVKNADGTYHVAKLISSYNRPATASMLEEKSTTHVLEIYTVKSIATFDRAGYELKPLGDGVSYTAIEILNFI
jgi:hypothetical protein